MKKRVLTAAIAAMCFVGTAPVSAVPITGVAENLQEQTVLTENNDVIYGIGVSKEPDKTTYKIGEQLDLTGLRLNGSYRMGELISTIIDEDYQELLNSNVPIKIDASEFDNTKAGRYHIYVVYGNTKTSFTVTVYDDAITTTIAVTETKPVTVQTAETEEKPIISEKLKQDIDAGLEKIDVMMWCTFKIDYSKIHPEVNKATEEYKNTLDTSVYSADEINEMVGAFKNNLSDKMYQEAYAFKTKEVCDFIGIDVSEANFTGTALRCSLTPEQIYKIAGTDLVKGRVIEQCEYVSADDLGYNVVEDIDNKAEDAKKAMEILNAYFKENNMDAKCVTSEEYPSYYPPLVIEYVAETVTGKQIMEFVEKKNIDNSLFEVVPIINGQKVYWVYDNVNIKGDANCDGSVDMADAVIIMQALANPNKYGIDGSAEHHLTEQGKLNGDMNGDGLTVGDAQAIQLKLLGFDDEPTTPTTAQPIGFKDMDTAIDSIGKCDVNVYPEEYREDYRKMFERIKKDGFIYQVTDNETIKINNNRGVAMFPYARYEDIGVGYYVTFKEKNYHIMFYYADAEVLDETDGIAEYLKKRMGRSSDKTVIIQDKDVSLLFPENGQCYANAFIDENHYFDVIGAVSEDELIEFLNAFEYEKLHIEDDVVIEPITPITAQPIRFNDINELINILNQYEAANYDDLNNYPEEYRDSYCQMYERFVADRFVFQVQNDNSAGLKVDSQLTLFPSTKYEDIGVGYYLTYNDKTYHVMFYYTYEDVYTETDGIAQYLKKRMGRSSDKTVKIQDRDVSLLFAENGQCYANAFIDENHYLDVIGVVSEDDMTELLNALNIYKFYFEQPTV